LLQECSRKNKMATLDKHKSVLAAILSDISDHSDKNFIIYCRQTKSNKKE